jgi:hypothetical protein
MTEISSQVSYSNEDILVQNDSNSNILVTIGMVNFVDFLRDNFSTLVGFEAN